MLKASVFPRIAAYVATMLLVLATSFAVLAHEIRPAVVTISIATGQQVNVLVSLNLEALVAGVGPEHKDSNDAPEAASYNSLRALGPDGLRVRFGSFTERWINGIALDVDGVRVPLTIASVSVPEVGDIARARISDVRLSGVLPAGAKSVRWTYGAQFGSSVVRVRLADETMIEGGWLKEGAASAAIALAGAPPRSTFSVFVDYAKVGFTHIVPKGIDHILFVLGLFLFSTHWRPLLLQVTAFTVAHSLTLALGLYGVVDVSPRLVEPLIALSIVYVAVENIITPKLQPWRLAVVFGFGLLHGLGFAGILQELGLPRGDYVTGLIGFNVGVELGQLAVIAVAWLVTGLWFGQRAWYRQRVVIPASVVIALAGLFWTVERIWLS